MDYHPILGAIGGVLAIAAIVPYLRDVFRGTTRPNFVSFFIWELLLIISLTAQMSAGASWSAILLIGDLIGNSTALVICLMGYGYKKYGWLEWTCLGLAIVAIIAWQLTHQPVLAIMFAIVADAMAAIPTLAKAWRDPWSEYPVTWLMIAAGGLCAVLATTIHNPANLLFPSYLLVVNGVIGFSALIGRAVKKRP